MKIRASSNTQYWNYSLDQLNSEITSWETWFACGNTSEPYDLYVNFENEIGTDIARIKFEYVHEGTEQATDYIVKLYYMDSSMQWVPLESNYPGGYLYNGWYKLTLERNSTNRINYTLYQNEVGVVSSHQDETLTGCSFSDVARATWSSTKEPVVCPMFFFDEHTIGITPLS